MAETDGRSQCDGVDRRVREAMKRLTGYKDYGWAWSKEEFDRMAKRVKEIELRNMTGTWSGLDSKEESGLD